MVHSEYVGQEQNRSPQSEITKVEGAEERELNFNIFRELEYLKNSIVNGARLPLTDLVILDRQLLLDRLETIEHRLPAQLATAMEITERQEEIVSQTETYVNRLVSSAQEKAAKSVSETSIMRQSELAAAKLKLQAERECERLRQMATAESQEIIAGADGYAAEVLGKLEHQLNDMLSVVKNGRQQLEGKEEASQTPH